MVGQFSTSRGKVRGEFRKLQNTSPKFCLKRIKRFQQRMVEHSVFRPIHERHLADHRQKMQLELFVFILLLT